MEYFSDQQKKHALRPGEICIEIDQEHEDIKRRLTATDVHDPLNPDKMKIVEKVTRCGNRNVMFLPVEMRTSEGAAGYNYIRTRRELIRDGEDSRFMMDPALRSIDAIPGERIHFDPVARTGRITDAIFDPENDSIYQQLKEIGIKIHGVSRPFISGIYHEEKFTSDFAMWNWAWEMRKIMDGNREHCGGPPEHRGCSTTGTRFCRPIQNCHLMPTRIEIIRSGKLKMKLGPMSKEMADDFDANHKENDPEHYRPIDRLRGEVIMTPWLAGVSSTD